jgi:hypothetical protein
MCVAALPGGVVGYARPPRESEASGNRAYGLGAAPENDPDIGSYLRLEADVASSESNDKSWEIRVDIVKPGGATESGAGLAAGPWDLAGWTGLKLASTALNIDADPSGTAYTAVFTLRDQGGLVTDSATLGSTKP